MSARERPCRLLLHSAAPKGDAGGVQAVVRGLADHLRGCGHEVKLAWPDGEGSATEWRLPLEAETGPSGRPGPLALARAVGDAGVLAGRLAAWRPDVVNLHFLRGPTAYFDLLARFFGYRLVLSCHNSDLREPTPAVRRALPAWLGRADAVTAVSNDLAALAREIAPAAAPIVIPNGVATAWWTPGDAPGGRDPLLAVAAGRLLPMKGFDVLLDAFAAGAPATARLVIAGAGADRATLHARAARLGLGDRVEFAGLLPKEALRALLRRAGLFVLSSRREGMPLALIEALACGCPALATRVNGVPDVMSTECGEMVPPDDRAALAGALSRWLGDGTRLTDASAAARARAERFSDAAAYDRYERVLVGDASCSR